MTSKEFANGLFKLANEHKNDNRTIFDTNWNLILTETANYILELQRQIDDLEHANESWVDVWNEKMAAIEEDKKMKANKEVKYDDIVPTFGSDPGISEEELEHIQNVLNWQES